MNELQIIEYNNQRVLTTQQLAEVFETETANIKTNFNRNKDRFVEGRDYYKLTGDELKEFKGLVTKSNDPQIKFASILYLWTERGANRHSKILDTDKAWQQFDVLEETYFKVKNNVSQINSELPTDEVGILKLIVGAIDKADQEVKTLKVEVDEKFNDMPFFNAECDEIIKAIKKKATYCLGGYRSPAYTDNSIRGKVYKDIHKQIQREFEVETYKAINRKHYMKVKEVINNYELPVVLNETVIRLNSQQSLNV